jgi:Bacterial SH3 domain
MRKFIFTFLFLFTNVFSIAQDRYWIINDTKLFEKPSTESKFYGYFRYGAEVKIIEDLKNGWLKVQSDNFTIGFVKKELIRTTMNGNDKIIEDPSNPIIKGGDAYYGGNHLFVTVAGLNARSEPNKGASIKEILTNGDAVSVDYYPINPEEWVNIGTNFESKYSKFVLAKFLGKRPVYEDLLIQFDQLQKSNIAERKTIGERLVELTWNSGDINELPALERYLEVAKQLNDEKLIKDTEFNILIAKNLVLHSDLDFKLLQEKIQSSYFEIHGFKFDNTAISYTDLLKKFGKPLKIENVEDECGIYLSNVLYHYSDFIISVDQENNKAELVETFFKPNTKFYFDSKSIFSQQISEKDFILKYGQYLEYSFKNPHFYNISFDSGFYSIYFKDGVLYSIEVNYYC